MHGYNHEVYTSLKRYIAQDVASCFVLEYKLDKAIQFRVISWSVVTETYGT